MKGRGLLNGFIDLNGFNPSGPFGGGNLIGQSFTLTTTVDTSITGNANFFAGGSGPPGYFGPSPMTAALTVNSNTVVFDGLTGPLAIFSLASSGSTSGDGVTTGNQFPSRHCIGVAVLAVFNTQP
jgi:hypothetical protein